MCRYRAKEISARSNRPAPTATRDQLQQTSELLQSHKRVHIQKRKCLYGHHTQREDLHYTKLLHLDVLALVSLVDSRRSPNRLGFLFLIFVILVFVFFVSRRFGPRLSRNHFQTNVITNRRLFVVLF